jgi:hypothetical protein
VEVDMTVDRDGIPKMTIVKHSDDRHTDTDQHAHSIGQPNISSSSTHLYKGFTDSWMESHKRYYLELKQYFNISTTSSRSSSHGLDYNTYGHSTSNGDEEYSHMIQLNKLCEGYLDNVDDSSSSVEDSGSSSSVVGSGSYVKHVYLDPQLDYHKTSTDTAISDKETIGNCLYIYIYTCLYTYITIMHV